MNDELAAITRTARQHERRARRDHQDCASDIEPMLPLPPRQAAQHGERHDDRKHGERHIPQKDHRPMQVLGNPAAERRSAAARGHERDGEISVVTPAFFRRSDVAEHHIGGHDQAAGAAALHHPAENQHQHVGRGGAGKRTDHVDRDPDQHRGPPAVDIGKLSVERRERGRGDQKGGDQPWQIMHLAEIASDGR
jgi:hypothetical protein